MNITINESNKSLRNSVTKLEQASVEAGQMQLNQISVKINGGPGEPEKPERSTIFKQRAKSIQPPEEGQDVKKGQIELQMKKVKKKRVQIMEPVQPAVELYDISKQPHAEQVSYSNFVKKKFSLYKVMFNKYAVGPGETLKPIQFTFDSVVHLKEVLSLHSVNKFLTEFQIQRNEFKK